MMSKSLRVKMFTLAIAAMLTAAFALTGCGTKDEPADQQSSQNNSTSNTNSNADISGSITAAGSTALQPLAEPAAQKFMEKYKNAKVQVQGGGSGVGLTQVSQGAVDIGNSDVYAAEKLPADTAKQLVDHKVCVVGFATVVNPSVKVNSLTKQQLIDIFTGKVKNWKDAGGDDMEIVVLNRPSSSGTRATFKKYALDGQEEANGIALTEESSGTIKKVIGENKGSISYLALSYVDSSVKALQLDGVAPTADNVKSGKYPIWSYEHMYTKGEPTGLAKAFLDYMMGDEVKSIILDGGYIPLADMKTSRDN